MVYSKDYCEVGGLAASKAEKMAAWKVLSWAVWMAAELAGSKAGYLVANLAGR